MIKSRYYLKTYHRHVLGIVKVNEENNVMYWKEVVDLLNQLDNENKMLKEALKNSYNYEICENCEYARYESYVDFEGFEDCDFECLKGCEDIDGRSECDDFKLKF